MRKLLPVFFVLFIFLLVGKGANAQATSQRWVCLDAEKSDGHEATIESKGGKVGTNANNRPLPNTETFIVECLTGGDIKGGQKCTTGSSEQDQRVFGKNMVRELTNTVNYKLLSVIPADNPVTSDANGYIGPIKWQSETHPGTNHRFMAMNYYTPQTSKCDTPGAQQQCTFTFDAVSGKCVSLGWDPKGVAFDTVSLEPIPGLDVQLMVERNGQYVVATIANTQSVIQNPYRTGKDGEFEFYVKPGNYKLEINDPRYTFSANPQIDPNYTKAYGVAPASIYKPGEVIVQSGNEVQYRDIPLEPVGEPTNTNVHLMNEGFIVMDKINDVMIIEQGRFSHPFTKVFACKNGFAKAHPSKADVCADPNNPNKLGPDGIAMVDSNHRGEFTIQIPMKGLKPSDFPIILRGRKVPLTKNTKITVRSIFSNLYASVVGLIKPSQAHAQTVGTEEGSYDPILNNIEGYAYDANGAVLPNATVGVYFTYSNAPYYETKADEKGYFRISSSNLPDMPYVIRYTSNNGVYTTVSTSKFITQNEKFITDNNINLFTFVDAEGNRPSALPSPNNGSKPTLPPAQQNLTPQEQSERAQVLSSQANMVLITLILLIFLLLGAGGLFLYMRKRASSGLPPDQFPPSQ